MTTHQSPHKQDKKFNGNPFSLMFNELSKGFKINQNPTLFIIIVGIVIGFFNQLGNVVDNTTGSNDEFSAVAAVLVLLFVLFVLPISIFVQILWVGFTAFVGVKNANDTSVSVGESLKAGLKRFWKILGFNLLLSLIVTAFILPGLLATVIGASLINTSEVAGLIVTIIGGLSLLAGVLFAVPFYLRRSLGNLVIMDENLGIMESMSRSASLTKSRLIETAGFFFATSLIPFISHATTALGMGAYYAQLKDYRDHNKKLPGLNIWAWLPMVIGFLVMVGFTLLLVLVFAAISASK